MAKKKEKKKKPLIDDEKRITLIEGVSVTKKDLAENIDLTPINSTALDLNVDEECQQLHDVFKMTEAEFGEMVKKVHAALFRNNIVGPALKQVIAAQSDAEKGILAAYLMGRIMEEMIQESRNAAEMKTMMKEMQGAPPMMGSMGGPQGEA